MNFSCVMVFCYGRKINTDGNFKNRKTTFTFYYLLPSNQIQFESGKSVTFCLVCSQQITPTNQLRTMPSTSFPRKVKNQDWKFCPFLASSSVAVSPVASVSPLRRLARRLWFASSSSRSSNLRHLVVVSSSSRPSCRGRAVIAVMPWSRCHRRHLVVSLYFVLCNVCVN